MKMKKYVVEFIAAFFIVLTTCMAILSGLGHFAPLAAGIMYIVMVYAARHISGAHFNPAITLALYLKGKHALGEFPPYLFAQAAGSIVAALLSGYLLRSTGLGPGEVLVPRTGPALLAEFLGTFAICYVYLHMTIAKGTMGNTYFGAAIGGTTIASVYTLSSISAGVFNPAFVLGMCTAHIISWDCIWIYLLASFVAGAVAAFVFNYVNGPE